LGNPISSVYTPFDGINSKYSRKHLVSEIPPGTKHVDVILEGQYISGSVAGAYFDDIELGYTYEK
jgi:hypothetical protein